MNSKLISEIRKMRPEFGVAQEYFYIRPVGDILCGFVYERARGFRRAYKYSIPLYDRLEALHITFSEKIAGIPFTESKEISLRDEAQRFVDAIEPHRASVGAMCGLTNFLVREERPESLRNPRVRRAVALTHIMLGNVEYARDHLQLLFEGGNIDQLPNFREDISEVARKLSTGIASAQALLLEWKKKTIKRFDLV